jgi:hypothetical protein
MVETKTNESPDQTLTKVDEKETEAKKEISTSTPSSDLTNTNASDQQKLDAKASSNTINQNKAKTGPAKKKLTQANEKTALNPPVRRCLTARKSTGPYPPSKILKSNHGGINKSSSNHKKDDLVSSEDDDDDDDDKKKVEGPKVVTEKAVVYGRGNYFLF